MAAKTVLDIIRTNCTGQPDCPNPARLFNPDLTNNIQDLLRNQNPAGFSVMVLVFFLIGMLFFTNILIAAFEYITSNGDQKKFQSATNRFLNGFYGLVIAIASFTLIKIVTAVIGLPNLI